MKEFFKKIQKGMKEFFALLAQELIEEKVSEALTRERANTRWSNERANIKLLETIVNRCPEGHFIVLSTDPCHYQGQQEARNVMRANSEKASVAGTALKYPVHSERPISSSDYQTAYAINPYSYEYRVNSDKILKDMVKCLNGEFITYFEYASFN